MDLRDWIIVDHASVHARFEQAVVRLVPEERWTEQADGGGSSIAWLLLHFSYHQDLAVQTALANRPPLMSEHRARLGLGRHPAGAGLGETEDRSVTSALDLGALQAYALAVHAASQTWLAEMPLTSLEAVPEASWRLSHHADIAPTDLDWLHAMWDGKPVSWFVQWEVIAHGHGHVAEAISVRNRLGLSPF